MEANDTVKPAGKDKTAAISKANGMIEGLGSDIEAYTSKTAELEEQIASLKDEIAKNDAALRKADAMRQKDLAESAESFKFYDPSKFTEFEPNSME